MDAFTYNTCVCIPPLDIIILHCRPPCYAAHCIRIPPGLAPSSECIYHCHLLFKSVHYSHFSCNETSLQVRHRLQARLIRTQFRYGIARLRGGLLLVVPELGVVSPPPLGLPGLARNKRPGHDIVQYIVRQIVFITPYRDRVRNCSANRVNGSLRQIKVGRCNSPSSILCSDSTVTRCFFASSLD